MWKETPYDGDIMVWENPMDGVSGGSGKIGRFNLGGVRPVGAKIRHEDGTPLSFISVAHEGRTLALVDPDGVVKLWVMATGRERLTLNSSADPVERVGFSPDGFDTARGRRWRREDLERGNGPEGLVARGPSL